MSTAQTDSFPQLFKYPEAAEVLGVAEITLRKAVCAGRLQCTKVGSRSVRFTTEQLRDYCHMPSATSAT